MSEVELLDGMTSKLFALLDRDRSGKLEAFELERTRRAALRRVTHLQIKKVLFSDSGLDLDAWQESWRVLLESGVPLDELMAAARAITTGADEEEVVWETSLTGEVVREGHLVKSAADFGKARRRFFQLKDDCLWYYTERAGDCRGVVPLRTCSGVRHGRKTKRGWSFELLTPYRGWMLWAASKDERNAWVAAIERTLYKLEGSRDSSAKTKLRAAVRTIQTTKMQREQSALLEENAEMAAELATLRELTSDQEAQLKQLRGELEQAGSARRHERAVELAKRAITAARLEAADAKHRRTLEEAVAQVTEHANQLLIELQQARIDAARAGAEKAVAEDEAKQAKAQARRMRDELDTRVSDMRHHITQLRDRLFRSSLEVEDKDAQIELLMGQRKHYAENAGEVRELLQKAYHKLLPAEVEKLLRLPEESRLTKRVDSTRFDSTFDSTFGAIDVELDELEEDGVDEQQEQVEKKETEDAEEEMEKGEVEKEEVEKEEVEEVEKEEVEKEEVEEEEVEEEEVEEEGKPMEDGADSEPDEQPPALEGSDDVRPAAEAAPTEDNAGEKAEEDVDREAEVDGKGSSDEVTTPAAVSFDAVGRHGGEYYHIGIVRAEEARLAAMAGRPLLPDEDQSAPADDGAPPAY